MPLKLLCDENIHVAISHYLRQEGYDLKTVQEEPGAGSSDEEIIEHCRRSGRVLITNDSDFFDYENHPGILFVQRQRTSPRKIATSVKTIERHLDPEDMRNIVLHLPGNWA